MSPERLEQTLEALLAFFRSEAFAATTYAAALTKIRDPTLQQELIRLRNSHAGRAFLLRERLGEFGGSVCAELLEQPWGAFANAYRRLLRATSLRGALVALREGEALGLRDYEIDLSELEPQLREEVGKIVLSEQRRTCERLQAISLPRPRRRAGSWPTLRP